MGPVTRPWKALQAQTLEPNRTGGDQIVKHRKAHKVVPTPPLPLPPPPPPTPPTPPPHHYFINVVAAVLPPWCYFHYAEASCCICVCGCGSDWLGVVLVVQLSRPSRLKNVAEELGPQAADLPIGFHRSHGRSSVLLPRDECNLLKDNTLLSLFCARLSAATVLRKQSSICGALYTQASFHDPSCILNETSTNDIPGSSKVTLRRFAVASSRYRAVESDQRRATGKETPSVLSRPGEFVTVGPLRRCCARMASQSYPALPTTEAKCIAISSSESTERPQP